MKIGDIKVMVNLCESVVHSCKSVVHLIFKCVVHQNIYHGVLQVWYSTSIPLVLKIGLLFNIKKVYGFELKLNESDYIAYYSEYQVRS